MSENLDQIVQGKAQKWLDGNYDSKTKDQVKYLMENDKKELTESFYKDLEFGTGGLRGIMGVGTNRMNVYTVGMATQGLANYLKKAFPHEHIKVAIGHDSRNNSRLFSEQVASIFAANGFKVYLFDSLRPTPELSFAIRRLGCQSGVVITASHNPKEYNGYKVYGEDGAQMSPEATDVVVSYIEKITDYFSVREAQNGLIKSVPKSVDKSYYKKISKLTLSKAAVNKVGKSLKLVYTPVHGSGYVPVTTILKKLKINVTVVPEQVKKDTEFSTVEVPNPEFKETLSMGIALAQKIDADVVFGTDPDSDRLGVAIKNDKGEFVALSGNQVGILLLDYILTRLKEEGKLPANGVVV